MSAGLERAPHTPQVRAWPRAHRVLEEGIAAGAAPGAVAEVRQGRGVRAAWAVGFAALRPERRPMQVDTWFDLASLTKVLSTLPALLALAEDGRLALDEPASRFLPELSGDHAAYTLRHLLAHVSGLPSDFPWRELRGLTPAQFPARVADLPLRSPPGSRILYSDIGFLLLGEVVRRVSGLPLDRYVEARIHGPLGAALRFGPVDPEHCAATEDDPDGGGALVGVVHDEKSRVMGGVTGHAGLFGTASGVAEAADLWRRLGRAPDGRCILAEATVQAALAPAAVGPGGERRGLGFELAGGGNSAGDLLSGRAFGHTGFTGTSVWVDPDLDLTLVLLTNRVHLGRDNLQIRQLRQRFANAVVADLAHGEVGQGSGGDA
jgi:CubicO group peptidase (beta-lactamase class C family)